MRKYLRAIVCVSYSIIRFIPLKLIKFGKFKFGTISIISPFTEISIGRNAKLYIGNRIKMRSGSRIRVRNGAETYIGENTSLNHGCIFTAHEKITIGNDVQFGPNVMIYDHDHDFKEKNGLKELKYKTSQVTIGNNVWIGANTIILRGTHIGDNCVIGAGSVIKGDFPNNVTVVQKRENKIIQYKQ